MFTGIIIDIGTIVELNKAFNTQWGNWKTGDDKKRDQFIETYLKGNQMMQGQAKYGCIAAG